MDIKSRKTKTKQMKNIILSVTLGVVVALLAILMGKQVAPLGSTAPSFKFNSITTSTASICNARVQVVGSTGNRAYIKIENISVNPILCLEEGDVAAANSSVSSSTNPKGAYGHYINAMSTTTSALNYWELSGYTGVINCVKEGIAANATATITTSP